MTQQLSGSAIASAYDRWAEAYDTDVNATRDLDAVILRRFAPDIEGLDVLELGCGTGKNTVWLAERARSVLGLDASDGMLAVARARVAGGHVRFARHDIETPWPIPDASIDAVIGNLVLEHVERVAHVFIEAVRVLRRDGAVFVCELHPARQVLGARAHFLDEVSGATVEVPVFRHTVSEFVNSGLDAGLRLERMGEWSDDDRRDVPPRLLSLLFRKR